MNDQRTEQIQIRNYDLIVIGGGQSALACGYFLRRTNLNYIILDEQEEPGGAWLNGWDTLSLFSPPEFSSLPGWLMPASVNKFPSRKETISYLKAYQEKYKIPILRSTKVSSVNQIEGGFELNTSNGKMRSKMLISATGTWGNPFIPEMPGRELFKGEQIHSAHYTNANSYKEKKVLIVGGGNSGAQLLAEISTTTETVWSTQESPTFLPDEVDGRVLFNVATERYNAQKEGRLLDESKLNLANIVMVPSVVDARDRGVLHSKGKITRIIENGVEWESGELEMFDVIVWCTGFRSATQHLDDLGITDKDGRIDTTRTKVDKIAGLWLVGYGNWTGYASATLIGVGRSAKATITEVDDYFKQQ